MGLKTWLFVFIFAGCTTADCKYSRNQKPEGTEVATVAITPNPTTPQPKTVQIFKYDGSKQCAMKSGTPLEDMEKELKGITILGRERKQDGKMRIQMCGADSGWANVYTISEPDLKKAKKLKFQEWKF